MPVTGIAGTPHEVTPCLTKWPCCKRGLTRYKFTRTLVRSDDELMHVAYSIPLGVDKEPGRFHVKPAVSSISKGDVNDDAIENVTMASAAAHPSRNLGREAGLYANAGSTAVEHAVRLGIYRYIADTGSGLHLVPASMVRGAGKWRFTRRLQEVIDLDTAGGDATCEHSINVKVLPLHEGQLTAHILDGTPPVLSVGRLCIDHDYEFSGLEDPRIPTSLLLMDGVLS